MKNMGSHYFRIDGSYGEGGGQILRSALSCSVIFSKPVDIINIRKGRKKSGLQPQHLTCVNVCRDISDAHVEGNEIGSTILGALGKTAEEVAIEACRDFFEYHKSNGAIEPHLADQLIPYIAISPESSSFTTTKITRHLMTNIWIVKQFVDADISVSGMEGEGGRVVKSGSC